VALIITGRFEQGIGLAIIGGALGAILAISSVLHRTSAAETFSRGLLLYVRFTVAKNIPGGDELVPIEDKPAQGKHGTSADPGELFVRGFVWVKCSQQNRQSFLEKAKQSLAGQRQLTKQNSCCASDADRNANVRQCHANSLPTQNAHGEKPQLKSPNTQS